MSKIAWDVRFWRKGTAGLGRYSQNLVREILKLDKENEYTAIITPADEKEFDLKQDNLKVEVIDIPHYSLSEQTKLLKYLKSSKFDLVHFSNFNHPIFYKGKFVVTIHDLIQMLFKTDNQKDSMVKKIAYKKVICDCKRAQKIIVPSNSTKNDLINYFKFPENKIVVTYEGSEETFKPHSDIEQQEFKERMSLPKNYLLFVSRWAQYKGIEKLIETFGILRQTNPELGLVIAGKPDPQSPDIEKLIRQKQADGWLILTPGFIPEEDLPLLYSSATVFVHPSFYEGFGIMILEAMASGIAVATSNRASLPEVAGDAAVLFNPDNPEEMANKIKELLENPELRGQYVQRGLTQYKKFSWAKMAGQTLEVYREVLK